MEYLEQFIASIGGFLTPILVVSLLGAGMFLTLRLGFIQLRRLGHGIAVTSGRYDDPNEPGDVSHFQALTTALSATVGIGNIAGVALAIHIGGPGALFWMWVTAFFGMATKYSEVTLAQHYRVRVEEQGTGHAWAGSVAGGPMYYIENGLRERFGFGARPVAIFFAFMLMITSFMTGNAIQANTIATQVADSFSVPTWITGALTTIVVGMVIIGGIRRIGAVTSVLAPVMASVYVFAALVILALHYADVIPAVGTIVREAFQPTAGIAGTGIGVFLTTMAYGVQRGLFSNEAGQGSAPIAHSAAQTDEPVSEGVVALLEPFIDTLIICTMTGLVIVATNAYSARVPTEIELDNVNVSWVTGSDPAGYTSAPAPAQVAYTDGKPPTAEGVRLAFYGLGVATLYADPDQTRPFTGVITPGQARATDAAGAPVTVLYGNAARTSSPLTTLAFERGLASIGMQRVGHYIVLACVFMFAISTAISWSYYGDRCANYLWGTRAILPYKFVFLTMHFVGAILAITTIWDLGDVALSLVTLPNVITLVLLSGMVKRLSNSYFERKPWEENYAVHQRLKAQKHQG